MESQIPMFEVERGTSDCSCDLELTEEFCFCFMEEALNRKVADELGTTILGSEWSLTVGEWFSNT